MEKNSEYILEEINEDDIIDGVYKIKEGVTIIASCFAEHVEINKLIIPEGVKIIESWAFSDCGIKEVEFPESLESIEQGAFCTNNIANLTLPFGIKEIGNIAFCDNAITNLSIPCINGLYIGREAFTDNYIKEVYLSPMTLLSPLDRVFDIGVEKIFYFKYSNDGTFFTSRQVETNCFDKVCEETPIPILVSRESEEYKIIKEKENEYIEYCERLSKKNTQAPKVKNLSL